jgi:hypothetical protein
MMDASLAIDTTEAEQVFIEAVEKTPEVLGVWKFYRDHSIDLWAVVEGDLYQAERAIAKAAANVLRSFPGINFDFMVVPRAGRQLSEIISEGVALYQRCE